MLYMKSCPRCRGDVQLDADSFGAFAKCLQCGFSKDFPNKRSIEEVVATLEQKAAAAQREEAA